MKTAEQLKAEIIFLCKQLGWSYNFLAEVVGDDHNANDEELKKNGERLKKQLQRDSTPVERLQGYLQIIHNHPDYRKTNRVVANPIRLDVVDIGVLRAVQEIAEHSILFHEDE